MLNTGTIDGTAANHSFKSNSKCNLIPVLYLLNYTLKRPFTWIYLFLILFIFSLPTWIGNVSIFNSDMRAVPIAVVDEDNTELSRLVIKRLSENDTLELKDYGDPFSELAHWKIDGVFVIKGGFSENIYNGVKEGLLYFYYPPGYTTPEIIGEIVSKEIVRIFVSYKAMDYVKSEYTKRGREFDLNMEIEVLDDMDRYWEDGSVLSIDISYSGLPDSISSDDQHLPFDNNLMDDGVAPLRVPVTNGIAALVILFFTMFGASPLFIQKENGVFTRLSLYGINRFIFAAVFVLSPILLCSIFIFTISTAVPFIVPLTSVYFTYLIWSGMITVLTVFLIKGTQAYYALASALPLLLTAAGGTFIYLGEGGNFFNTIGMFNPVYCIITGGTGLMAWVVLAHAIITIIITAVLYRVKGGYL